ncbi:MAG: hypothetical protein P1V36_00410 [Planctomycetota bacterium]|nr:hypothetical protein [Planctomycetota bacterium]
MLTDAEYKELDAALASAGFPPITGDDWVDLLADQVSEAATFEMTHPDSRVSIDLDSVVERTVRVTFDGEARDIPPRLMSFYAQASSRRPAPGRAGVSDPERFSVDATLVEYTTTKLVVFVQTLPVAVWVTSAFYELEIS